ncbi:hypothetical protein [Marivirga sp.]|uniref:hypothetical protein n=1 Tax=Marivirga sp. TaxID=2018662 RepID=UPI0025FD7589|nr:hypothetical protein [Marivirga sp.]
MNYLISLYFIFLVTPFIEIEPEDQQQSVLQTVFNIEEFQKYIATEPRFLGSNIDHNILMMGFSELKNNEIDLKIRDHKVKIISERKVNEFDNNSFIKIAEFDMKKSTAKVLLSYQNSKLFYEKKQKILLDVQLEKSWKNEWVVKEYKLYEVSINTSD